MTFFLRLLLVCLFPLSAADAQSVKAIDLLGSRTSLTLPKSAEASVILMPGGSGRIGVSATGELSGRNDNVLLRIAPDLVRHGFAVMIVDEGTLLSEAIAYMRTIKQPVTVVGTSRGTWRAARALADGARPDRLVLSSGLLSARSGPDENVIDVLGTPERLPQTLIIHHRDDQCRVTLPEGVEPFMEWAGKKARLVWVEGGVSEGNPCKPRAHHGFNGVENKLVDAIVGFAGQ